MNEFYVQPGTEGILKGLGSALEGMATRDRMQDQQARLQQGAELLQSNDPNAVAQWAMTNPDLADVFWGSLEAQDKLTKEDRLSFDKRVLTGVVDPRAAYEERINEIRARGGNATHMEAFLAENPTPEEIREASMKSIALRDPRGYQSFASATGVGAAGPKTGTYNPRDYTTESWAAFVQGGKSDPSLLKRYTPEPPSKLTATGEKALIDSQQKFMDATNQSREYEVLASDYNRFKEDLPAGAAGTFSEFIKGVTGSQDEATELRRRFAKVRMSEALKYLPPGPATDRDVEEAFKGVPKENASPEQVNAFLRGAAKMSRITAEFEEFRSNYISEKNNTKGMLKAWKEAVDNGEVQSINDLEPAGDSVEYQGADLEAYNWAQANPNDPRAAQIMQRLGAR